MFSFIEFTPSFFLSLIFNIDSRPVALQKTGPLIALFPCRSFVGLPEKMVYAERYIDPAELVR